MEKVPVTDWIDRKFACTLEAGLRDPRNRQPERDLQMQCTVPYAALLSEKMPAGLSASRVAQNFPTTSPTSIYDATSIGGCVSGIRKSIRISDPYRQKRCPCSWGQVNKPDQGIFSYWLHSHLRKGLFDTSIRGLRISGTRDDIGFE